MSFSRGDIIKGYKYLGYAKWKCPCGNVFSNWNIMERKRTGCRKCNPGRKKKTSSIQKLFYPATVEKNLLIRGKANLSVYGYEFTADELKRQELFRTFAALIRKYKQDAEIKENGINMQVLRELWRDFEDKRLEKLQ